MSRTPILDFVRAYAASGTARLHMPGHKGRQVIGPEGFCEGESTVGSGCLLGSGRGGGAGLCRPECFLS